MKVLLLAFVFMSFSVFAQEEQSKQEEKPEIQIVEASCGSCNFGVKGSGCSLMVKIDGKVYPVDGSDLHDHGDPHTKDGMCNVVRKAKVSGEIKRGRFKADSFDLLPEDEPDAE